MGDVENENSKFPVAIQATSYTGYKLETDLPLPRNKGVKITPGPIGPPASLSFA